MVGRGERSDRGEKNEVTGRGKSGADQEEMERNTE